MVQVSQDIERIRDRYGLAPDDKLKFATGSRPSHVSQEDYTSAKKEVIEACIRAQVSFVVYMVMHRIAVNSKTKGEWALNSALVAFGDKFLKEKRSNGIVVIDRLPEDSRPYDMLRRKFQNGLSIDSSGYRFDLKNIVLYVSTCDGASHLSSAVDIVLGSFRWVVNQRRKNRENTELAKKMFEGVAKLMYYREEGGHRYVREYGLVLRPKILGHPPYRSEYEELVAYLQGLLNEG
jgi:hypothetical protein